MYTFYFERIFIGDFSERDPFLFEKSNNKITKLKKNFFL